MNSDFSVGFKQGQEHGKQIILEKVNEAIADIETAKKNMAKTQNINMILGLNIALSLIYADLGEELEHE